jgi:hypothetical protein
MKNIPAKSNQPWKLKCGLHPIGTHNNKVDRASIEGIIFRRNIFRFRLIFMDEKMKNVLIFLYYNFIKNSISNA